MKKKTLMPEQSPSRCSTSNHRHGTIGQIKTKEGSVTRGLRAGASLNTCRAKILAKCGNTKFWYIELLTSYLEAGFDFEDILTIQ